jgi:molybdate transport system substrate-binding protein
VDIVEGFRLEGMLGDGKLAMAAPGSVPAGRYAKAALEKLGVWTRVEQRIASAENVRVALQYVSRGEAPYGIVYETDARADPAVAVLGTFPEFSHPQIIYPAAVLAASANPAAATYLEYLKSPAARPYFENEGFKVLAEDD